VGGVRGGAGEVLSIRGTTAENYPKKKSLSRDPDSQRTHQAEIAAQTQAGEEKQGTKKKIQDLLFKKGQRDHTERLNPKRGGGGWKRRNPSTGRLGRCRTRDEGGEEEMLGGRLERKKGGSTQKKKTATKIRVYTGL